MIRILCLVLLVLPVNLYALNPGAVVDQAVRLYGQDPAQAVQLLRSAFQENPAQREAVKNHLLQRGQYELWAELLSVLPPDSYVVKEMIHMELLAADYIQARELLAEWLIQQDPAAAAQWFGEQVLRPQAWSVFQESITNTRIRRFLMEVCLLRREIHRFDQVLLAQDPAVIPAGEVLSYLQRSWPMLIRDTSSLMGRFSLTGQPALLHQQLYNLYLQGRYTEILSGQYQESAMLLREAGLDYAFLMSRSAFFNGEYQLSGDWLNRITEPWLYDMEDLFFLNHLGLGEVKPARTRIRLLKSGDKQLYYTLLLDALENKKDIRTQLQSYLVDTGPARFYHREVMLLAYVQQKEPQLLGRTAGLLVDHLLSRLPGMPVEGLAAVLWTQTNSTLSDQGWLQGFDWYQTAGRQLLKGDTAAAKKTLSQLLDTKDISPLFRQLGLYRLQDLEGH